MADGDQRDAPDAAARPGGGGHPRSPTGSCSCSCRSTTCWRPDLGHGAVAQPAGLSRTSCRRRWTCWSPSRRARRGPPGGDRRPREDGHRRVEIRWWRRKATRSRKKRGRGGGAAASPLDVAPMQATASLSRAGRCARPWAAQCCRGSRRRTWCFARVIAKPPPRGGARPGSATWCSLAWSTSNVPAGARREAEGRGAGRRC